MATIDPDARWTPVRTKRNVWAEPKIKFYRLPVTPTESLTVERIDGVWEWRLFTIRTHDWLGHPAQLALGFADTMKAAKLAGVDHVTTYLSTQEA